MNRVFHLFYYTLVVFISLSMFTLQATVQASSDQDYETIEWLELMPQEDYDALMNPPDYLSEIEDGSLEDEIDNMLQSSFDSETDDAYQAALSSTKVVEGMNGKAIKISGFVVPVEYDDDLNISEFFLVPFFGACIHVPPPPPNQIIYVKSDTGFQIESLYQPFWVKGTLTTSIIKNDIAKSAYLLQMDSIKIIQ